MIYNPSFAFGLGDDADLSSKDYVEPNHMEGQGKHRHTTLFIEPDLINANNIKSSDTTIILSVFSVDVSPERAFLVPNKPYEGTYRTIQPHTR